MAALAVLGVAQKDFRQAARVRALERPALGSCGFAAVQLVAWGFLGKVELRVAWLRVRGMISVACVCVVRRTRRQKSISIPAADRQKSELKRFFAITSLA